MPEPTPRCVVLFTKPAVPGRVKTRLIGKLSAVEAAALHDAFVADMLDELGGGPFALRIAWALNGGEELPESGGHAAFRQCDGDLGDRLFAGLTEGAGEFDYVAAVGSDHPEIGASEVASAFERLEAGRADVVFGPVADGGYYLVAVRSQALSPRLFAEIDWSTEHVLSQSLARCRELGLRVEQLPEGSDVDRPEDLERLRARLIEHPDLAPHTARLLRGWEAARAGSESSEGRAAS